MTNELVAVVDQFFDTNRFDFTTNYFQGYDLALATNSNQITLRVTDLAGNVTTTNLSVALDYTAATSPGAGSGLADERNAPERRQLLCAREHQR
ncbi:MAG: hypothetical protein V9H26_05340 [Verrucomicrobiota bacterium]